MKDDWKIKAGKLFEQFKNDPYDTADTMAPMLIDISGVIRKRMVDPKNDPFCKEVISYLETFVDWRIKGSAHELIKCLDLAAVGDFFITCDKFELAHFCFDTIIKLHPNSDRPYIYKAKAYRKAVSADSAIKYYKLATDINPLRASTYYTLAEYQRSWGLYLDAHTSYKQFLVFENSENEYMAICHKKACIWVRYLEKKMELFGEKRG